MGKGVIHSPAAAALHEQGGSRAMGNHRQFVTYVKKGFIIIQKYAFLSLEECLTSCLTTGYY